jgi:hypothetical protein
VGGNSSEWQFGLDEWHRGVASGNWTILGTRRTLATAEAVSRGWIIRELEEDPANANWQCLASDGAGDRWFLAMRDEWCVAVPLPPRVLTPEERISRARKDEP